MSQDLPNQYCQMYANFDWQPTELFSYLNIYLQFVPQLIGQPKIKHKMKQYVMLIFTKHMHITAT